MRWIVGDIDQLQGQTLYWSGVILAVAVAGFGTIWLFKHFWKKSDGQAHEAGFSLSDLRAMRDRGEITPASKQRVLGLSVERTSAFPRILRSTRKSGASRS